MRKTDKMTKHALALTTAAAALLLLTLPGPVFLYQGDEIGMTDAPAVRTFTTRPVETPTATPCNGMPA